MATRTVRSPMAGRAKGALASWLLALLTLSFVAGAHSAAAGERKGLTWGKALHNDKLGINRVSCHGLPRVDGGSCNPYQGDTSCTSARPILCVRPGNLPRPAYGVQKNGDYYAGWMGKDIGLTPPVRGDQLTSLQEANAQCEAALGSGFRMAEHHDGQYVEGMGLHKYFGKTWPSERRLSSGGWGWFSYGDIAGSSRFWVHINDQPGNCWNPTPAEGPAEPAGKGLTWGKALHNDKLGIDLVSCHGVPLVNGGSCNPYEGDTSCSAALPILCFKPADLPRPAYDIPPGREYYYGWSEGVIELTPPVRGDQLTSLEDANRRCEAALGSGYRMAEHHDGGGGWAWYALGNISGDSRFWVHINDQEGNCWSHAQDSARQPGKAQQPSGH